MGFTHLSRISKTTTPTFTELFGHMSSLSFVITFLINSFFYWHSVSIFSRAQKGSPPLFVRPPSSALLEPTDPRLLPRPQLLERALRRRRRRRRRRRGRRGKGEESHRPRKGKKAADNKTTTIATRRRPTNCVLTFDVPPSKSVAE